MRRASGYLLSVFLIALLAGCGSSSPSTTTTTQPPVTTSQTLPTTTTLPTGVSLANAIASAAPNLKTYQSTSILDMKTSYQGSVQVMHASVTNQMDAASKKGFQTSLVTIDNPQTRLSFQSYLIGQWMYLNYDSSSTLGPGIKAGTWYKMQMDTLTQNSMYSENSSNMFTSATITVNGSEIYNGIDCWNITLIPDKTQMANYLISQGVVNSISDLGNLDQALTGIVVTEKVAKDTNFIVQTSTSLTMSIQGATAVLSAQSSVSKINQSFSIDLPPEAINAQQIG